MLSYIDVSIAIQIIKKTTTSAPGFDIGGGGGAGHMRETYASVVRDVKKTHPIKFGSKDPSSVKKKKLQQIFVMITIIDQHVMYVENS